MCGVCRRHVCLSSQTAHERLRAYTQLASHATAHALTRSRSRTPIILQAASSALAESASLAAELGALDVFAQAQSQAFAVARSSGAQATQVRRRGKACSSLGTENCPARPRVGFGAPAFL